jgi:phenylalanyl-tRNA synthetase alpha chain
MTREDLEGMIRAVTEAMLPGAPVRLDPAVHPYTQGGLEVHAQVNGRWVEVLECGLAAPAVLEAAGLADRSGLAMGIGLDRMLMLRKGIEDIRVLRSDDPRIAKQMLNLDPWHAVSSQPAIQRDLSIAVATTASAEELGDKVRGVLGNRSDALEEISVMSETSWWDLSVAARRRLGMTANQKNVLLRLVIRDLSRTLTSVQANELRDEVYAALHEGSVSSWAARESL